MICAIFLPLPLPLPELLPQPEPRLASLRDSCVSCTLFSSIPEYEYECECLRWIIAEKKKQQLNSSNSSSSSRTNRSRADVEGRAWQWGLTLGLWPHGANIVAASLIVPGVLKTMQTNLAECTDWTSRRLGNSRKTKLEITWLIRGPNSIADRPNYLLTYYLYTSFIKCDFILIADPTPTQNISSIDVKKVP